VAGATKGFESLVSSNGAEKARAPLINRCSRLRVTGRNPRLDPGNPSSSPARSHRAERASPRERERDEGYAVARDTARPHENGTSGVGTWPRRAAACCFAAVGMRCSPADFYWRVQPTSSGSSDRVAPAYFLCVGRAPAACPQGCEETARARPGAARNPRRFPCRAARGDERSIAEDRETETLRVIAIYSIVRLVL
jgi:hypothetical protein